MSDQWRHLPQLRACALPFDLQMFAGEKTEPATEKRRQDARERGQVAKSQDLESALVLLTAFLCLRYYGPQMFSILAEYLRFCLTFLKAGDLTTIPSTFILFQQATIVLVKCLAPIFLAIVVTAVTANVLQIGFLFTFEPFSPDFDKLNPVNGMENIVSWKAFGELVKGILKIIIVSYIPYSTVVSELPFVVRFVQLDPMTGVAFLMQILFSMSVKIILVLVVLALADYIFQSWRFEENLKMSKEEIKEEYKQREGDPKVKAKIRERQRRMANARMMQEVPKATVVVTNPTHIAVALLYNKDEGNSAPKIVAMGAGLIAQRIKEIAKEHDVPILENKPLAQALHKAAQVGDEVPEELWQLVAELLVQVYNIKGMPA